MLQLTLRDVGLYRITGTSYTRTLAANLEDHAESDLLPVVGLGLGETLVTPQRSQPSPSRELWPALLFVALILLLVEWLLYHKVLFF